MRDFAVGTYGAVEDDLVLVQEQFRRRPQGFSRWRKPESRLSRIFGVLYDLEKIAVGQLHPRKVRKFAYVDLAGLQVNHRIRFRKQVQLWRPGAHHKSRAKDNERSQRNDEYFDVFCRHGFIITRIYTDRNTDYTDTDKNGLRSFIIKILHYLFTA